MKNFFPAILLLFFAFSLSAQHSSISVFAQNLVRCGDSITYLVSVSNIDVVNDPQPLLQPEVTMDVYNDNNEIVFFKVQGSGPIGPADTETFMMVLRGDDIAANGNFQVQFSFQALSDENEDPISPLFELEVKNCPIGPEEAKIVLTDYIQENSSLNAFQAGFMFPLKISAGTRIRSVDPTQYDQVLNTDIYLGFAVSAMNGAFEQPCKYLLLDPKTQFVQQVDAMWYPIIDNIPWNPIPLGDCLLTGYNYYPDELFIFSNPEEVEPEEDPLTCALLVSGTDFGNQLAEQGFINSTEIVKEFLTKNPRGPRLPESQVLLRPGISRDSLYSEIELLSEGYEKIYFYYAGNSTSKGEVTLADGSNDWTLFEQIISKLYNTSARDHCIIFDCNYSGLAIEAACSLGLSCTKNSEIITSTDADSWSYYKEYKAGDSRKRASIFTSNLMQCLDDNVIDSDGDGKSSLIDGWQWLREINPMINDMERMVEVQNPLSLKKEFDDETARIKLRERIEALGYSDTSAFNQFDIFLKTNQAASLEQLVRFYKGEDRIIPPFGAFGIIDLVPNSFYPRDQLFFTYLLDENCENPEINIELLPDAFWIELPEIFNPNDQIKKGEFIIIQEPEVLPVIEPNVIQESCAILVGGEDLREETKNVLNSTLLLVKNKLSNDPLGPKIKNERIHILQSGSKEALLDLMSELKDSCGTVYFYYIGNATKEELLVGITPNNALAYTDLWTLLSNMNAKDYQILLDSPNSADALSDLSKTREENPFRFQSVFVCNNESKVIIDDMDLDAVLYDYTIQRFNGISRFTNFFLTFYLGEPESNLTWQDIGNRIEGLSLNSDLIRFTTYNRRFIKAEEGEEILVTDEGTRTRIEAPSSGEVVIEKIWMSFQDNNEDNGENVIEKSGEEEWYFLSDDSRVNPAIIGNITIDWNETIDSFLVNEGELALVYRPDTFSVWTPIYPIIFDAESKSITAENVLIEGFFRFAIVQEETSTSDLVPEIDRIMVHPNPFIDEVFIDIEMIESSSLMLSVIGTDGRLLDKKYLKKYQKGNHKIKIDLKHINSGPLFIRIQNQHGKINTLRIVKQ